MQLDKKSLDRLTKLSDDQLRAVIGKLLTEYGRVERLLHVFSALDFDFELLCRPDCIRDGEVHLIRMSELLSGRLPATNRHIGITMIH